MATPPQWSPYVTYSRGDLVLRNGVGYHSNLNRNFGQDPLLDPRQFGPNSGPPWWTSVSAIQQAVIDNAAAEAVAAGNAVLQAGGSLEQARQVAVQTQQAVTQQQLQRSPSIVPAIEAAQAAAAGKAASVGVKTLVIGGTAVVASLIAFLLLRRK